MSEEIHGYLRATREQIKDGLNALRTGQLEVWDISMGRRNVSHERIEQYEAQLTSTEDLMQELGISFDA